MNVVYFVFRTLLFFHTIVNLEHVIKHLEDMFDPEWIHLGAGGAFHTGFTLGMGWPIRKYAKTCYIQQIGAESKINLH